MMGNMGYNYQSKTRGIKALHKGGIEFNDGSSQEAEVAIVVTNLYMRNPDYRNIFAVGDAASVTVPKIGSLGHMEAEVVANMLGMELGVIKEEVNPMEFELLCMGDMGGIKGFFKHSSFYQLLLGSVGAIVAYVSGSYAGDGMTDGLLEAPMELHEEAATVTLWLAANKVEQKHRDFYIGALAALDAGTDGTLPTLYFLCPTCGNTYATVAPSRCEISMTDSNLFVRVTEADVS